MNWPNPSEPLPNVSTADLLSVQKGKKRVHLRFGSVKLKA